MITGMTLNPCNDLTLSVPEFVYGAMNRVHEDRMDIAGKGYNFARCVARMGVHAGATGMLYSQNGKSTELAMRQDGVFTDCVWQEGRIRTNIKLFDEKLQTITEINQNGTPMTKTALEELKLKAVEFARRSELMVFSGSLPPDCPVEIYKTLIELCKPHCKTALDADGLPLALGMRAAPYLVKPNKAEFSAALNRNLGSMEEIVAAMREVAAQGVSYICVTLGGGGALMTDGNEMLYAAPVPIEVKSTVGAGDAMMAGLCTALTAGAAMRDALRQGVGAATAACTLPGTQIVDREMTDRYVDQVEIEVL